MTLDTGPFCSTCGIHRVMTAGSKCPGCLEDAAKGTKQ